LLIIADNIQDSTTDYQGAVFPREIRARRNNRMPRRGRGLGRFRARNALVIGVCRRKIGNRR